MVLLFLKAYWKQIALSLAAVSVLLLINHWRLKANELDVVRKELATCNSRSDKLKETNDALQADREAISARLAAAKQRLLKPCVAIAKPDAFKTGAGHAGSDGSQISGEWLLEYSARCELYRRERITLEHALAN